MKEGIKQALSQRVEFVLGDAKTYIYARKEGLVDAHGLGGGNFATAYALFALINLLSKTHYYLHKPSRFASPDDVAEAKQLKTSLLQLLDAPYKRLARDNIRIPRIMETNEEEAFIDFAQELEVGGLRIWLHHDSVRKDLGVIWKGFRNMLSHVATVQDGKGIMAYSLRQYQPETGNSTTVNEILQELRMQQAEFPPFFYVNSRPGWVMNIDVTTALLDDMLRLTHNCIDQSDFDDVNLGHLLNLIKPT